MVPASVKSKLPQQQSFWRLRQLISPVAKGAGLITFALAVVLTGMLVRNLLFIRDASTIIEAAARSGQHTAELDEAIRLLTTAQRLFPDDPMLHRQLARAQLLQGNYGGAIAALERAYTAQPDSLLIPRDLAALYAVTGSAERAQTLWASLGYSHASMVAQGNSLFVAHQYTEARLWYQAAAQLTQAPTALPLDVILAAQSGARSNASQMLATLIAADPSFPILSPVAPIVGGELRLIEGSPQFPVSLGESIRAERIRLGANDRAAVGVLWRNSEALAALQVAQAGSYRLQLRVQAFGPPPAKLELRVNGEPVAMAVIWDEQSVSVEALVLLQPGASTVSVAFLNEYIIQGGIDRRIELDTLTLEQQ